MRTVPLRRYALTPVRVCVQLLESTRTYPVTFATLGALVLHCPSLPLSACVCSSVCGRVRSVYVRARTRVVFLAGNATVGLDPRIRQLGNRAGAAARAATVVGIRCAVHKLLRADGGQDPRLDLPVGLQCLRGAKSPSEPKE
jgi:hypothetical protein